MHRPPILSEAPTPYSGRQPFDSIGFTSIEPSRVYGVQHMSQYVKQKSAKYLPGVGAKDDEPRYGCLEISAGTASSLDLFGGGKELPLPG